MFEHHFGLRENPFPAGHQLKFVYPSREHQEARAHLRYGIENREPFLLITGEVGTGKTTSLYDALNEWGDRVAVALITNSALTRQEMIEELCLRFGLQLPSGVSKPAALVALEKHLIGVRARGEHAVLMMDEAQNLSMELLEEIRLLSNLEHKGEKLLQVFLVGQPELETHLGRHELRQLRQRITVHYRLNPLSPDETLGYIHHHINVAGGNGAIVFPSDTCREIFRLTHGIPREINTLASAALIAAYADNSPSVTLAHLAAVAMEGDFRSVVSSPAPRPVEATPAPAPAPPQAAVPPAPVAPRIPTMPLPPAAPAAQQPAIPANWPFPQSVPQAPIAPVAPPQMPAPVAQQPYATPPQPRGESNPGLLAAMRRAEAMPPAPPAPPPIAPVAPVVQRPTYVTPPMAQPAAPPPMMPRMAVPQPPAPPATPPPPPPIPLPVQRVVPQTAEPTTPDLSGLSPRLRERLEREMAREEAGGGSMLRNLLIVASVIATLGITLILLQRFGAIDVPFLRAAAGGGVHASMNDDNGAALRVDPTAVMIDSLNREAEKAKRDTAVHTASTHTMTHPNTVPVVTPSAPAATPTPQATTTSPTVATPAAPTEAPDFGIGAATTTDLNAATAERDRLQRATTLPAQVMSANVNGTMTYYVVLGHWTTSAEAQENANLFKANGMIGESRVVSFPKH